MLKDRLKQARGPAILVLVTMIWGISFVAQSAASESMGSFTFIGLRSLLAALLLALAVLIRFLATRKRQEKKESVLKKSLLAGLICGGVLFVAANLQQFGIASYGEGVASSGRAGFITSTYVLFIAVFTWIKSRKFSPMLLIAVVVCMGGMYLLCFSGGIGKLYLGDLLVFLCAVSFAVHILVIDRFADCDGLLVSCVQFGVCGVTSVVCAFAFEKPEAGVILQNWLPLVYTGILSSGVGYTLQIFGQKYTKPQTAAIILSLESVFAALSGWALRGETLGALEIVGCVLVFLSVIAAQLPDSLIFKRKPKEGQEEMQKEGESEGEEG